MANIETLQNKILDKVQTTGEQAVQHHKQELDSKLDDFKAKLNLQEQEEIEAFKRETDRQLKIKQQSLVNELRNNRLSLKQNHLKGIITESVFLMNQTTEENFTKLVDHIIKKVNKEEPFVLQFGAHSQQYVNEHLREFVEQNYPNAKIEENLVPNKSGFIVSQKGINFNYLFEDVVNELAPELLIELDRLVKA